MIALQDTWKEHAARHPIPEDTRVGDRVELKVRPFMRLTLGEVIVRNGKWLKVRYTYGSRCQADFLCHIDDVARVVRKE